MLEENTIEIIEYDDVDLSNAMLIITFPTVGLVGPIAGNFLVDSLDLEEMGYIESKYFMPATVIRKSEPRPPVRIYAGEEVCGPDESCEQIALIISEFPIQKHIIKQISTKLFTWAESKGCRMMMELEGMHAVGKKDESQFQVYGVGSNKKMQKVLKKYNIQQTKQGMITGLAGVLLYEGMLKNKEVLCLLTEAHTSFPDSRAAARLLEKIDKMFPSIDIDPEPLYQKAEDIEKNIKKFMEQSKPSSPSPQVPAEMYR